MNLRLNLIAIIILLLSACSSAQQKNIASNNKSLIFTSSPHTLYVRKNVSTAAATADLKALNIALHKMREMKCTNPLSWYYQGATHSIPNIIGDAKKPANPLCPSYTNIDKTPLQWGWKTCTHKNGSEIHFLIWHRLYIAHFESIVRKLSGKSDFALPYWDYTDKHYRIMPEPFRNKSTSLYTAARLPGLNKGRAIEKFMDSNLDVTDLFEEKVYRKFNSTINVAPHGAMHNYIGGGYPKINMWNEIYQNNDHIGLMQEVDSAGFDPIFWMHHSNIDYLWQKWENSARGSRPKLTELEAVPWPYKFFNADGTQRNYSIAEAYNAAFNPDYVYDQLQSGIVKLNTSGHKLLESRNAKHIKELVWSESIGKSLASGKLQIKTSSNATKKVRALKGQPHIDALVLQLTTKFTTQPSGLYSVYIIGQNKKKQTAGTLSFFGAVHHATSGGQHNIDHEITKDFTFDISDEISLGEEFTIVIGKDAGENSNITVEKMSLYIY